MLLSLIRPASLLALGILVLPACVTRTVPAPQPAAATSPQAVVAPTMTIERFLRAVNQKDLDTMARLFGTRDGSIVRTWTQKEIDDRMFALSSLLRHTDYTIGPEEIVPGRRSEAAQYVVTLTIDTRRFQVPFTVVRSAADSEWLVEIIDVQRITRAR